MSTIVPSEELALALLDGLGLKDQAVISLQLTLRQGELPTVTIEKYITTGPFTHQVKLEVLTLALKSAEQKVIRTVVPLGYSDDT